MNTYIKKVKGYMFMNAFKDMKCSDNYSNET